MRLLKGNKGSCPHCEKLFTSMGAYNKHRVGATERRCMTDEEMFAIGMKLKDGFWTSSKGDK